MAERTTGRTFGRVVLGLLIAGALALVAVTRAWASTTVRTPGLPTDRVDVSGADAAPLLVALAIVVVAGGLAVVAAGGWFRQAVGLIVAAAATWAAVRALSLDVGREPLQQAVSQSPAFVAAMRPSPQLSVWPYVAAFAFIAAALLGLVVVARGRQWPRMGARYERPATSEAQGTDDRDLWRAFDEGHDPTV